MKSATLILIAFLLSACATGPRKPGPQLGMTREQVVNNTFLGNPMKINRTVTAYGISEQWIYPDGIGGRRYLYFRNGSLVGIQD